MARLMTTEPPTTPAPLANLRLNERAATTLSYLLVTAMLTCAAVPFVEFGKRVVPTWQGDYLLWAAAVFALEALLSARAAGKLSFPSGQWFLYRLTEIVVLFTGLKLYVYVHNGLGQLVTDVPLWSQNAATFFSPEFIFACLLCLGAWGGATYFAGALSDLEGDDLLYIKDGDRPVESDRGKARKQLLTDIFLVGGVMLFVTAIVRADLSSVGLAQPVLPAGLLNVVLYFVFGLILFAQSQFAVLRAQWSLDQVPIAHNIAPRWAAYALILLLVCAALVIFLPTRYSLGLLDTLAYVFNFINFLLTLLLILVWLPIRWLMSLFTGNSVDLGPVPLVTPTPTPPVGPTEAASSSEIIKSILFWITFLSVMFFSIYYYVLRRTQLFQDMSKGTSFNWLRQFWKWLTGGLRGIQVQLGKTIQQAIRRVRPIQPVAPWSFINLRRLSAREQVRFYYLALLKRSEVPRQPSQTPLEYKNQLTDLPQDDLKGLTESYIEARYTPHSITNQNVNLAKQFWENLRKALRKARLPLGGNSPE